MSFRDPVGELRRFAQLVRPPWLLAVSGGRDSMALLFAAKKLKLPFDVVTVNHGLRPAAAREAALVVSVHPDTTVVRLRPPKARSASLQWARNARYAALRKHARGRPILTAHHRDDLVETLLLQLFRGTSTDAWATFSMAGVHRPFLRLPRTDLERFVLRQDIPYLDDPSNDDERHPRAVIRNKLVPLISEFAPPGWQDRFTRFAGDVSSDSAYLASLLPARVKQPKLDEFPEPLQRRAVWRWLLTLAPNVQRAHLDAVLLGTTSVKLPGGKEITRLTSGARKQRSG